MMFGRAQLYGLIPKCLTFESSTVPDRSLVEDRPLAEPLLRNHQEITKTVNICKK